MLGVHLAKAGAPPGAAVQAVGSTHHHNTLKQPAAISVAGPEEAAIATMATVAVVVQTPQLPLASLASQPAPLEIFLKFPLPRAKTKSAWLQATARLEVQVLVQVSPHHVKPLTLLANLQLKHSRPPRSAVKLWMVDVAAAIAPTTQTT